MTLETLFEEFLANYAERRLRPSTVRGYETNIRKHILPIIGTLDIYAINPGTLDHLNDSMPQLCNKSKVYVHATLRKALNYAIRREYISKNPYNQFDLPRIERYHYKILSETQMKNMLLWVKGYAIEIPVTLALKYGLRRGESLGIIPSEDVIEKQNILHIQRTKGWEHGKETVTPCKTEKSNRLILLDPKDTKMLMQIKSGYACSLTPNQLNMRFEEFLELYDFPKIRFHDLRHSFATFMLSRGVSTSVVQNILGHSRSSTTNDTYWHPDIMVQMRCLAEWQK